MQARKRLKSACGLNLREHSSGKRKSGLHITKRGPSRVRQYLYLAALRLLKQNPIVRAWYASRVARGQKKICAVVAVVRKLVRSLPFVARGEEFNAAKLFDVRRLNLQQAAEMDVEITLAEVLQLDETSVSETTDTAPEPAPAAPKENPHANSHVPKNALVARKKNERTPSPSKRVPSRADAPQVELAKRGDAVLNAASGTPQDTDPPGAIVPPTGRARGRTGHEETGSVIREARSDRPAPTSAIARALP